MKKNIVLSVSLFLLCSSVAFAGGGPFGIDSKATLDTNGIFERDYQKALYFTMGAITLGGALWKGGDTRTGRTFWQSIDAWTFSLVSTGTMKILFTRKRPFETDDPDEFFKGDGYDSFPSHEVSLITALITPFVLEYRRDQPLVYLLEVIPAYIMMARVKHQRHWQSDVIAGFAVGTLSGLLAHSLEKPLILRILPQGFMVGLEKKF